MEWKGKDFNMNCLFCKKELERDVHLPKGAAVMEINEGYLIVMIQR